MLKEAKKWVQDLETTLAELAKEFNKSVEELDAQFEEWYNDGGAQWDMPGSGPSAIEAFAKEYRYDRKEEAESEAYEEVYKKMRRYAYLRDYELTDEEIEAIIDECEEDGDNVLGYPDGRLREIVEDWVADHQTYSQA